MEQEEKRFRRRKNPRERAAIEAYERAGWQIMTRGFPCFLARKAGQRPRFVWVERKNASDSKAGLSAVSQMVFSIFSTLGLDTRVVSPETQPLCDRDLPFNLPPSI